MSDSEQEEQLPDKDDIFYGVVTERDARSSFQSSGAIIQSFPLSTARNLEHVSNAVNNFQAMFGRSAVVKMNPLLGGDGEIDPIIENYDLDTYFCPVVDVGPSLLILETRIVDAASPVKQVMRLKDYTETRGTRGFLLAFSLPYMY